jgi:hypothetical protein
MCPTGYFREGRMQGGAKPPENNPVGQDRETAWKEGRWEREMCGVRGRSPQINIIKELKQESVFFKNTESYR